MRFDWYEGAILDDPVRVFEQLRKLGHEVKACDGLARGRHYRQGFDVLHNDAGKVATVLMGGNDRKDGRAHAYAWATSENTDKFVDLVRGQWADCHLVTRADAAEDIIQEGGCTRQVFRVMRAVGKRHRLKAARQADVIDKTAGVTQYLGAPGSDVRARGYEKGYEVVGKIDACMRMFRLPKDELWITNTSTGELVRPSDWFRLELQVRPREPEARERFSTIEPHEAWGCTRWARELADEVLALELEAVVMRTKKRTTSDEKLAWMCRAYGGVIADLVASKGEAGAMSHILDIIREQRTG
jgi:hypothetical protein